jgi:hypothetical protein
MFHVCEKNDFSRFIPIWFKWIVFGTITGPEWNVHHDRYICWWSIANIKQPSHVFLIPQKV